MKQKLLLALLVLFTLGGSNLFAQTDVTSTYITNADFSSTDGWTLSASSQYHDQGNGLIGTYGVRTAEGQAVSTVDETHLATEYCFGFEVRWSSNFASYYQETQELPIGVYTLTFDVENTNTQTTSATYDNRFYVQVGEEKITDSSTEWMNGKSSWTTHTIQFTITEAAKATISLGYGTGSNNIGSKNTPTLHVSHLKLTWADPLAAAKDALQAEIDRAKLCDAKEGLADAIAAAEEALANATTAEELSAALAALQAADKDALLRYDNNLADASAQNGMTTKFVVNGTFDSNVNGWSRTGGFQNNALASNQQGDFNVPFWENWNGSAKENKMYQVINNIPNGTYKLKIAAFVNTLANPNESQFVFANNDKMYLTTTTPTFYEVWTVVTNNQVEIGLEQTTATANWMGIDNVSLTYYGAGDVISQAQAGAHKADWDAAKAAAEAAITNSDYANVTGKEKADLQDEIEKAEPTTAEGYDEATAALTAATEAFIAAKPNYDALVAEIAKAKALGMEEATVNGYAATAETTAATALTNTQNLKVAEYNYVTDTYQHGVALGEWTSTATNTKAATFNNEHWSGTTHEYKNQDDSNGQGWNANSWSINFSQNVTLPAGNYVFKVAGRQATGDKVNTSLVVKVDETELGSVSDFPRGNAARGINKNGETSFTESDEAYANSGKGYGWEWRYVKFTLEEDATVNIAINSVATASHMWVSFGDYTVQTDNEANISLIAYNIALNDAKTTLANNDEYANVTGEEKTALDDAISADATLDKSDKDAIEAATTALTNATSTFIAAKAAYDAFVAAKDAETPELKYAATSKKDAVTNAKEASDATSASDAETKTAAITQALRVYYESHALAEGVEGATQFAITDANMEVEYDSENHKFGAWQVIGQTNGTIQLLSDQSFTDGDGKNDYKYADIYKNDNNAGIQQSISLEPGKYMLSVTARANTTSGAGFQLFAGDKTAEISRIGNAGGTFDRGWNDTNLEFVVNETADVNIGVQSYNGKDLWWSATRFRLVKLPTDEVTLRDAATEIPAASDFANVTYDRKLLDGWNSLVLPFDVTQEELGIDKTKEGERVLEYGGTTKNGENDYTINFNDVEGNLTANTPYLIKKAADGETMQFTGKVINAANTLEVADANNAYTFVGTYVAKAAEDNFIKAGDLTVGASALKKVKAAKAIKAFRAFLRTELTEEEANNARISVNINGNEVDAIEAIEIINAMTDGIYNLQGQKVNAAQKGIYIVNGKKIVVR